MLYDSAVIFLSKFKKLFFVMETHYVFSETGTQFLNVIQMDFRPHSISYIFSSGLQRWEL
jgi:hypothetical protein